MQDLYRYIDTQHDALVSLLEKWANINSGSENIAGLSLMLSEIKNAFTPLNAEMHQIPLAPRTKIDARGTPVQIPTGQALHLKKHPTASVQIFLGGHYDTVYSATSPFQKVNMFDPQTMVGPGVADMKGGLIVMLTALQALERSPLAGKIGWEVLINPDEEVGSTSSEHLFTAAAERNHLGLIFEPTFPDGSLVSSRKGSANFTVVAHGKAAHVGRHFYAGRSAIVALARFIYNADALNDKDRGITINFGQIEGGEAPNIVPDFALCRLNVRMELAEDLALVKEVLQQLIEECSKDADLNLILYDNAARAPKPFDHESELLFKTLQDIGANLGLNLQCQPSGGVCDGNILVAAGLPTIDTLGAVGGNIHTSEEYIFLASLTERAKLVTGLLYQLASGELKLKGKSS